MRDEKIYFVVCIEGEKKRVYQLPNKGTADCCDRHNNFSYVVSFSPKQLEEFLNEHKATSTKEVI